jgi:hypothetical protein
MRRLMLAGLLSMVAGGCSNNRADDPGSRIRDTSATARDTMNPSDTLTHIRDSVPDSTRH